MIDDEADDEDTHDEQLQDESHSISCEQLTIEDFSSKSEISEELVTSQHSDNLSDQLSQHSLLS